MTDAVNDPNPNNDEAANQTVLLDEKTVPAKTEPADPVVTQDTPVVYEKTGDVGMDMALEFVGKLGIGLEHPAMKAAAEGDFSILKATLAAKGTPGWEQFVELGEAAYHKGVKEATTKQEKIRDGIYAEAGGKEQWTQVHAWASANATAEEKAEINTLLNQGGLAAKGAVKYLVDTYNRATNVEVTPRDPLTNAGRGGGAPAATNGPLTAREYAEEVRQLSNKLNGRLEGSKEYENLQRRRQAGR